MIDWLTQTELGQIIATFFISMVPVIELRGGLPYGIAFGLDYPVALAAAVLGNMLPVPFIILFIRRIFAWVREISPWCERIVSALERKAHLKGKTVQKYSALGLCVFVAIPLPGTGAWTGEAGRPLHLPRRADCRRHHDRRDLRRDPHFLREFLT